MTLVIKKPTGSKLVCAKSFTWNETVWDPRMVNGLALWLDGADTSTMYDATSGGSLVVNNGAVARWEDKSGNGRHATEGILGNRPLRVDSIQNSRPVVRFDGGNDRLTVVSPFMQAANAFTISWVFTRRGSGTGVDGYRPSISGYSSSNTDIGAYHYVKNTNSLGASYPHVGASPGWANYDLGSGTTYSNGTFEIMQFRAATTRWDVFRNSTVEGTYNPGTALSTNFLHDGLVIALQGNPLRFSNIDVCEVVVNLGSISLSDNQKLEGYLAWKWGLTANLPAGHPYKTVGPTP